MLIGLLNIVLVAVAMVVMAAAMTASPPLAVAVGAVLMIGARVLALSSLRRICRLSVGGKGCRTAY